MYGHARLPPWLRPVPVDLRMLGKMSKLMQDLKLHTVCDSAHCPNRTVCFSRNTATFLILGDVCTRNCTFCAVSKGTPCTPDLQEPEHVVAAVKLLGLHYVVITSVTRDDLSDGGSSQFARTVKAVRRSVPGIMIEVLVPDFVGSSSALQNVIDSSPNVINHNVETIPKLYPKVRPKANYRRSIELLKQAKDTPKEIVTKSGLMLGLGESRTDVIGVMTDLRQAGCDLLTLGQYLQPSKKHYPVVEFITPDDFEKYGNIGRQMGFRHVVSAPLVRSSFHAAETYLISQNYKT